MARRFNLDVDMDLALEGYDFKSRFDILFDMALDFGAAFNPNIAPQGFVSVRYAAFAPSDIIAPLSDKDQNPVDAPQLPGQPLYTGPFGASFELSSLLAANGGDGSLGFVINGIDNGDRSGEDVSFAGDINNDGFDDFLIGAYRADPNGSDSGETYVVFGNGTGFAPSLDLSSLDGNNGFILNGIDTGDFSGGSISSAGDFNGDGIDDIIIGANHSNPNGINNAGESYVVYGKETGFSPSLDLSSLNGTSGFVLNGIDSGDYSGSVSSAGDINGDGFDDVLIGANRADPNGNNSGETYLVFGSNTGFGASFELSSLLAVNGGNGASGFIINGIGTSDVSGGVISSAGDFNGDGFDDIIIGAALADPNGSASGESYIVFGSDVSFGASFELSSLNGMNGFVINGIDAEDTSGIVVSSAGDINGDGFDDILIGARGADPNGKSGAGESYVVFGSDAGFAPSLNLSALNGTNGFVINGVEEFDQSSRSVSSAGDINGDGFDDILIGAYHADNNGVSTGVTYVIFGSDAPFAPSLELSALDGSNGFDINGIDVSDYSGRFVSSAGDINGDGYDDIIIGAIGADPDGKTSAGESYVIYGQGNFEFELSSLLAANGGDGSAGFVLTGIDEGDSSGRSVSSAGDVNGDGFDDILIGASGGDNNGSQSGETYIVFGSNSPFAASLELSSLNGTNGFIINGIDGGDSVGGSVASAGDVNGDGFDDILLGANTADPNGTTSGESYVIFGSSAPFAASFELSTLNGTNGFTINGIDNYDGSGRAVSSAGDINGDGFDDILIGAYGGDTNGNYSGESYVVFGSDAGFAASLELSALNGTNGFVINGIDPDDYSGSSVSSAGDINNDGFDDILIGASVADPNGFSSGESYVIFGTDAPFAASLDLSTLNGSNGFVITGIDMSDYSGGSLSSAGDINGDGFDDILIGASGADPNGGASGESYVVFGQAGGFGASLELSALNGSNGFVINGIDAGDRSGRPVSSAGDINGDGFDDILIGADFADPNGNNAAGETYIVFGSDNPFAASFDLSTLDGMNGFILNGIDAGDLSGRSLSSAGDVNGDGFDDLIIGAIAAYNNGNSGAGESYVVYGSADFGRTIEILSVSDDAYSASNNGEVVYGLAGNDVINGGTASDVLFGDEGDDTLSGNAGNDRLEGGAGNDTLDGGEGNDTAVYNGNLPDYDIVNNGDGTYTVIDNVNGNGVDTLVNIEDVQIGTDLIDLSTILFTLTGTPGNDNLMGSVGDDVINGLGGNDILDGLAGDDEINGGEGADRLIGGEGADALNGGAGFDSADYRGAVSGVRFNVETGGTVGEAAGDTFSGLERYYLSIFNDIITGSSANEFFYGEDGNDQINGGGGIDRIYGGEGNDIQRGQDGNDTLYGSAGNDQLNGGAGFDVANYSLAGAAVIVNMLTGGTSGDAAGDTYFGIEAVYGSDFDDSLTGNNSVNELRGGDGGDALFGLGGNDRFFGGEGADSFDGGTGTDIVNYTIAVTGVTLDLMTGGMVGEANGDSFTAVEWVFGSNFDDSITGDFANNRLEGRDGNDTLNGEGGNDRLLGGDGNDTINGGDGVDTIFGQGGDDILSGGADNDFFFGGAGADSHDGGSGTDTVSYLGSSGPIFIVNGAGVSGDAAGDTYTNIERYFGSSFDDYIHASGVLLGNGGQDYLEGMNGSNDSLNGGAGLDSFGYDATAGGADVITGFFLNEQIEILGVDPNFDTQAEVLAAGTDVGANVIFDFGGGNTLTIVGHNLADLPSGTFTFAGAAEPLNDPDAFAADIVDVFDMDALV